MLIYYNLLDGVPFVQTVQNLLELYIQQGLDIFKTSFSVSGVAKLQMIKKIFKNVFFCLLPKLHEDLYKTLCSQLIRKLSFLIFCLLAFWRNKNPLPRNKKSQNGSKSFWIGHQVFVLACYCSEQHHWLFILL